MKYLLVSLFLMIALVLRGQPSQVTLRIDDTPASNIQWHVYDDNSGSFLIIPFANSDSLLIQQPGVYFATYSLPSCDKSTIPALVSCAIGTMTIESIQLNASSPDPASTYQWTKDGTLLLDSINSSIRTNMEGRYGVIIDKPACPLDTQLFDIIALNCMDSSFMIAIEDPCGCSDPLNFTLEDTFYFHERVIVTADPGITVRLDSTNSNQIFDALGQPLDHLTAFTEISPGIYLLDIWVRRGATFTVSAFGSNGLRDSLTSSCTERCLLVRPNCITNLNVSCGGRIELSDVVSNYTSGLASILEINLFDEFNRPLTNPLPSSFSGTFRIIVTNTETGESCESIGTVSDEENCTITNLLDTTVWCVDEFLSLDPNGTYYSDKLRLRPFGISSCERDTIEVDYEGEWINQFDCGDTLKQLIRTWRTETKDGNSCVGYDTITVIRLPDLSQYVYAPQKDTIMCALDTTYSYEYSKSFVAWKQLVNLHSTGSKVAYPFEHDLYSDITELYTSWKMISDGELRDSLGRQYERCPVLQRWNSDRSTYDSYSVLDIYEDSSGVLFQREQINGQNYAVLSVLLGDKIMTNGGAYIQVDENWFFEENEGGFWVDISYPLIAHDIKATICDGWSTPSGFRNEVCSSIEVVLPDHPYEPDSCKVFCISNLDHVSKCLDVVYTQEQDLGGSCPHVIKKSTVIKQSCVADGSQLATLIDVRTSCPLAPDSSGIVNKTVSGTSIEIEQWILYIDTLGPLLADYDDPKLEVFLTNELECYGEIELPSIRLKDDCSGVKEVKATVGAGYSWLTFNDDNGDGLWEMDREAQKIRLACGENYEVLYIALDSCHNSSEIFRHRVSVEDRTNPVVLTPDTLVVTLGGEQAWVEASAFDKGHEDNCGIARTLVRRVDWLDGCLSLDQSILCSFASELALGEEIGANGFYNVFANSEIGEYYAGQFDWLLTDGEWCDRPISEGDPQQSKDVLKNLLIEGWYEDVRNRWVSVCLNIEARIAANDDFNLGGGWGTKVPICCDDACDEVTVEVLVIDKNCNYTKGWTILKVNSNSTISKAFDFDEISVGCSLYSDTFQSTFELAEGGDQSALDTLDQWFGALQLARIGVDGSLVDLNGNPVDRSFEYSSTECQITVVERQQYDSIHDGEVIWKTVNEGKAQLNRVTKTGQAGVVLSTCGVECVQTVWIDLDGCGHGYIKRRWDCQACSGSKEEAQEPFSIEQKIRIGVDCELSDFSLSWPNDTMICGPLEYDLDGSVNLDADQPLYHLADSSCRKISIGRQDEVFNLIGESRKYKIHRTWKVIDWCTQESVEYVQKIVLDSDCTENGSIAGNVIRRDEIKTMPGVTVTDLETASSVQTNFQGFYTIDNAKTIELDYESEPSDGIDIRDILMIQRQLLSEIELTQYERLAGDVNSDNQIDISDLIIIRDLLLGNRSSFPDMKSWRFYHLPTLESQYSRKSMHGTEQADFVAIKMGDVVESISSLSRTGQKVAIRTPNRQLIKGEEVEIVFEAESGLEGFQLNLGIDLDKIDLVDVKGEDNNSLGWQDRILNDNLKAVTIISTSDVMKVRLKVKSDSELKHVLSLIENSQIVNTLGDQSSDIENLAILDKNANNIKRNFDPNNDLRLELDCFDMDESGQFALYQNQPNPFTDQTSIRFTLPQDMRAVLTLFDANGKVLHRIEGSYTKGEHTVSVDRQNLQTSDLSSGVIFYQFETQDNTATKQMLFIK